MNATFAAVPGTAGTFCSPSRGPTSTIVTRAGRFMRVPPAAARAARVLQARNGWPRRRRRGARGWAVPSSSPRASAARRRRGRAAQGPPRCRSRCPASARKARPAPFAGAGRRAWPRACTSTHALVPPAPTHRASGGPATATLHDRAPSLTTYSPAATAITVNTSPGSPTWTRPSASASTGVATSPCSTVNWRAPAMSAPPPRQRCPWVAGRPGAVRRAALEADGVIVDDRGRKRRGRKRHRLGQRRTLVVQVGRVHAAVTKRPAVEDGGQERDIGRESQDVEVRRVPPACGRWRRPGFRRAR